MAGRISAVVVFAALLFVQMEGPVDGCDPVTAMTCLQGVLDDAHTLCMDQDSTRTKLHECSTDNGCDIPEDDSLNQTCSSWETCKPYFTCIGAITGVDYLKVMFGSKSEKIKADAIQTDICSKDLTTWPTCVNNYQSCSYALIQLNQNQPPVNDFFLRVLNRYTADNIEIFKTDFCSTECQNSAEQHLEIGQCIEWVPTSKEVNTKTANSENITSQCQTLTEGIDCLKSKAGACHPIFDIFLVGLEDIKRLRGVDVVKAVESCDLDLPMYIPSDGSNGAVVWSEVHLISCLILLVLQWCIA